MHIVPRVALGTGTPTRSISLPASICLRTCISTGAASTVWGSAHALTATAASVDASSHVSCVFTVGGVLLGPRLPSPVTVHQSQSSTRLVGAFTAAPALSALPGPSASPAAPALSATSPTAPLSTVSPSLDSMAASLSFV